MNAVDPRMIALENQFKQLHVQLFDTFSHAQSAVMTAVQTGQDITSDNEDYQQLKRDFQVTTTVYQGMGSLPQHIGATKTLMQREDVSCLHMTQVWAAAVSSLCCDRMLAMVPEDLRDEPTITDELKQKHAEHTRMWQERLYNA
ncbi:hypothetical protein [Alteromonas gilva]|uniref:DUF2383 domain-containing protein n=1 Tax=Alteromonas gilva TaxID=2987522 RepID=A0ABT5L0A4_9ALTE|nr:hypothetical protein [Alteromonas gilva]MDC8829931.1 hypothetical protein [Alteromonas gilva]